LTGKAIVLRGDARSLPFPDESVDLIVTSPPYFALRSYRDNGEHYADQIGSEAMPQEFLEALWTCCREWWRVLKPEGSLFVNLGDKRAGAHATGNNSGLTGVPYSASAPVARNAPKRYNQASFGRPKSKMLLPHRFAIGCEDGLADPEAKGWIVRQDLIWQKLNGLPESVTDRHRDSHEFIFHLTKQERYFAAMDEVREPQDSQYGPKHSGNQRSRSTGEAVIARTDGVGRAQTFIAAGVREYNPLGKLPGSVWPMPSEPLLIPQWAKDKYDLGDHFAAFPTELPRKLILGFSPSGICVECGQGRRPVVDRQKVKLTGTFGNAYVEVPHGADGRTGGRFESEATITGHACACSTPEAPTRPALILDPFGGTGTVALVAKTLGRVGISVDLSSDYCKLANWRINHSGHGKKAEQRTWGERQEVLGF
jgi:DNA modification methylase